MILGAGQKPAHTSPAKAAGRARNRLCPGLDGGIPGIVIVDRTRVRAQIKLLRVSRWHDRLIVAGRGPREPELVRSDDVELRNRERAGRDRVAHVEARFELHPLGNRRYVRVRRRGPWVIGSSEEKKVVPGRRRIGARRRGDEEPRRSARRHDEVERNVTLVLVEPVSGGPGANEAHAGDSRGVGRTHREGLPVGDRGRRAGDLGAWSERRPIALEQVWWAEDLREVLVVAGYRRNALSACAQDPSIRQQDGGRVVVAG